MRTYAIDSPRAAARLVALTLLADGNVSKAEIDLLERIGAGSPLRIDRDGLREVLQDLCEDLLASKPLSWDQACRIDGPTLARLLGEVRDPALQAEVLRLCVAVAEADGHIADGEALVLATAMQRWGGPYGTLDAAGAEPITP